MKFGKLILRKSLNFCHQMPDFRAKMHQKSISVGWGSAPDPAVGAYSAPPDPLAGFEGPTSKGRGGEGRGGERRGGEGREREGGRKGKGEDDCYSKLF